MTITDGRRVRHDLGSWRGHAGPGASVGASPLAALSLRGGNRAAVRRYRGRKRGSDCRRARLAPVPFACAACLRPTVQEMAGGTPKRFCSAACRQRAYRARAAA